MNHVYQLVRLSANSKLGGLPASVTSDSTCPTRCSLRGNGCYAETGHSGINFRAVSAGRRGGNLEEFCSAVRLLPRRALWRHNQAGDLPGDGRKINTEDLGRIVHANRGRHGFTYTHYGVDIPENATAIQNANQQGFTINLSAETLREADEYVALGIAPVVVILPVGQEDSLLTPAGNTVTVCPAVTGDSTCATCAVCAVADRKSIIGFPAHSRGKKLVEMVFYARGFTSEGHVPSIGAVLER